MKKTWIVAITGRSGSGKSHVRRYYKGLGHAVADGDELARWVVRAGAPCLNALAERFGQDILDADGTLKRRVLAQRAFKSAKATSALNEITHPAIIEEMLRLSSEAQANGTPLFFIDAAAVVGELTEKYCDKIIVVKADEDQLQERIILRDALSIEQAKQRLAAQTEQAVMCDAAHYVIYNNKDLPYLEDQADLVLADILQEREKA